MRYNRLVSAFSVFSLLFFINQAGGQEVPGAAKPERLEEKFKEPVRPKSTLEPVVPEAPKALPPSEAEKIKFVLTGVVVEGATVYKDSDFLPLYEKFLTEEISLADVYRIASAITAKYRNDGYILSRAIVPPQRIKSGIVRLQIIEGFIDDVEIKGEIKGRRGLLETYAKKIARSRPLRNKDLERYLLLINDLAGVQVKSVLTPSENNGGASKLTLMIEHRLSDGFISMDNRGSRFIGPFQGSAGANINSVLGLYERTGIRFITTSPVSEMIYFRAYHDQQIGTEGTKINFAGSKVRTEPGHTLKDLDVEGNTTSISFAIFHPFIRSRGKNLSAHFGFSRNNSRTTILDGLSSEERLRVFNIGASYDFVDHYRGVNLFNVDLHQGANILNATETGSENLTRDNGKSDFTRVSGHLLRLQQIVPHWTLLGEAAWQYSFSDLLGSQEFGVGGSNFGRAYDSSEIAGDHGFSGKAELQWAHAVQGKIVKDFQVYAFTDYGAIWNKSALKGKKMQSLTSSGFGARYNLVHNISGYLEGAKPLARRVDAENNRNLRFFFSIAARF